MSDDRDDTLQFDTVVPPPLPEGSVTAPTGISCAACQTAIRDDYFDVNGQTVCGACRVRLLEHAEPVKGWGTFVRAVVFGVGAAIAGALLYYAVIAITNLEIGLVAIAIGYMVGWSVRAGARGRGGRRLQALAVVLTYVAMSLAYGGLAISAAGTRSVAYLSFFGLILSLPVIVVFADLPGGLISGAILAFGMMQAWRLTAAPQLHVSGPYRVGTSPVA